MALKPDVILLHPNMPTWVEGTKKSLAVFKKEGQGNSRTARQMSADLSTVGRLHLGAPASRQSLRRIQIDLNRL